MISKSNAAWVVCLLMLALLIASRPSDFASDYTVYEENFSKIVSGDVVGVEFGYQLFSLLSEALGLGFFGVLFVYAFIALYYKFKFLVSIRELTAANVIFFVVLYGVVFFPLWELTQMRNAAAVAVSCVAITSQTKSRSLFLFLFGAMLHNVAVIIFLMWLVYIYFYSLRYVAIFIGVVLLYFIIGLMPYFSIYSADVYDQSYNPLSFKTLYILATFVFVLFHSQRIAKVFAFYSFAFLALYLSMGQMPAAAVRIVDVALFFSIVSLVLIQGKFTMIYKFVTMITLGYVYMKIAFFADSPLLNVQPLLG